MNWYLEVLKKYAVFGGRARRAEYWMFTLLNFVIGFALGFVGGLMRLPAANAIAIVYTLVVLVPGLAVSVRRLHDTGRSGWWLLIALVPIVGALVLLYFTIQEGENGQNVYGPSPKTVTL